MRNCADVSSRHGKAAVCGDAGAAARPMILYRIIHNSRGLGDRPAEEASPHHADGEVVSLDLRSWKQTPILGLVRRAEAQSRVGSGKGAAKHGWGGAFGFPRAHEANCLYDASEGAAKHEHA